MFIDGRPFAPAQMQRLAREMNVAETVFLLPPTGSVEVGGSALIVAEGRFRVAPA